VEPIVRQTVSAPPAHDLRLNARSCGGVRLQKPADGAGNEGKQCTLPNEYSIGRAAVGTVTSCPHWSAGSSHRSGTALQVESRMSCGLHSTLTASTSFRILGTEYHLKVATMAFGMSHSRCLGRNTMARAGANLANQEQPRSCIWQWAMRTDCVVPGDRDSRYSHALLCARAVNKQSRIVPSGPGAALYVVGPRVCQP